MVFFPIKNTNNLLIDDPNQCILSCFELMREFTIQVVFQRNNTNNANPTLCLIFYPVF